MFRAFLLCLAAVTVQAAVPGFQKTGKGPGVLLIHGFGGNKEVWAGVAGELSRDHTVVRVDLPGSGGTAGPAVVDGRADFAAIAKQLTALVRKEGLAPCLIVGHSMGGPIAARTILEDPAAFSGLVLVDSFLCGFPAKYMEPIATGLDKDPKAALVTFFSHASAGPAQTQSMVSEALRIPVASLQAYLRALTVDPLQARHAELNLPVLQMAAGPRQADPAKEAQYLSELGLSGLPRLKVILFPTAKHWVMCDAQESFLLSLRAFEAGLAGRTK